MSEEWYLETTYDEAKRIIQANLNTMSRSFIAVGFYLKHIRDNGLYQEDGYHDIWEFAADQYGIQRSTASRWMAMNDRFSVGGNSPVLLEEYRDFGKSQLQEMLYLPEEKLSEAIPDMTVKEIRELRREEPEVEEGPEEEPVSIPEEDPVSILGYPLREYPEDSLITVPGCGKQDCFSCHWDGCGLRQVDCYCVEAPMGKPFPCTILQEGTGILRERVGYHCQFVNTDLAPIRAGDGQPVPCCKKCTVDCTYRCERSCKDLGIECAMPHTEGLVCKEVSREKEYKIQEPPQETGLSKAMQGQARMCLSNLQVEIKAKAWKAARATAKHLIHYLELSGGKEEQEGQEIQEYPQTFIQDLLREYEYELKSYQECNAHIEHPEEKIPEKTILKKKAVVDGLKMLLEAVRAEVVENE